MSPRVLRISLVVLLAWGIGLAWWASRHGDACGRVRLGGRPRRLGATRLCGPLLSGPGPLFPGGGAHARRWGVTGCVKM
jgi:hypothetical protein